MLQGLEDAGIAPDLVVATSVGALNGAVLAQDPDTATSVLARVWTGLGRSDVFPISAFAPARFLIGSGGAICSNDRLAHLIDRYLTATTFADLAIPLVVSATDLLGGHGIALDSGDLRSAVLASASIPGVFPPVTRAGQVLVDGGLSANLPIDYALARGARSVVVLDAAATCRRDRAPRSGVEMLVVAAGIMTSHQASASVGCATRAAVVYLPTPCTRGRNPMDFSAAAQLIELGRQQSAGFLADLDVTGPGLYEAPHQHPEFEAAPAS
jgi:NTE family protein